MQLHQLKPQFDQLQQEFGDPELHSIYGAGCLTSPEVCFVFMNPTGKNVAADPGWDGLRAPWIGTKNVWKLFSKIGLLSEELFEHTQRIHAREWTPEFAERVYRSLETQSVYITNLAKSTQQDARHLPDTVFRAYLPAFHEEIHTINPKRIITFGNQVSSLVLNTNVKVSELRKTTMPLRINDKSYSVFPTFYPVGQGMRNIDKAIEDIRWIMNDS